MSLQEEAQSAVAAHRAWLDRLGTGPAPAARQRDAARALLRFAQRRVPLWSGLLGRRRAEELPWEEVPTTDRELVTADVERSFASRSLRLEDLLAHDRCHPGRPLPGNRRLFVSMGRAAHPAVFVYDRDMWVSFLAGVLRRFVPAGGRVSGSPRLVLVGTEDPRHTLSRLAGLFDPACTRVVGLQRGLGACVQEVQAFRPDVLLGFSSAVVLLAAQQAAGLLEIAPAAVFTGTDLLGRDGRELVRRAWGVEPHDAYGCTEVGNLAFECGRHDRLHVNEDLLLVEKVEGGLAVTNLVNRVQPFIRYVLPDRLELLDGRCPCGLPYRQLRLLDGRSNRPLSLPGPDGAPVTVHPIVFRSALDPLHVVADVSVSEGGDLFVRASEGVAAGEIERRLRAGLRRAGVGVDRLRLRLEVGRQ